MKYMLIINNDPAIHPAPGTASFEEMLAGYYAFGQELESRKIAFNGAPLQPPATATTVRIRDGKTVTTDGPFAETKEWVAGYYEVDCKDLDEALELAARIPGARFGSVEVRPVASFCSPTASAKAPAATQAVHA